MHIMIQVDIDTSLIDLNYKEINLNDKTNFHTSRMIIIDGITNFSVCKMNCIVSFINLI